MKRELKSMTLLEARHGLDQRQFSARELTQAILDSIKQRNHDLNAYLHVADASALEAADQYDQNPEAAASPIAGIPVAIKDTIVTAGVPTTAGSRILAGYLPSYDATVVTHLKKAGAVIVGKTNCDEFAMGASGENSAFGPTRNPHDLTRVPGGSSSGSAAAVAADLAMATLGSDTGGSVRQPAGFCGVVGLRPTYGSVSRYGLIAMASSLDVIGTLTKTVEDAAIMLSVVAGPDALDATSHQARRWHATDLVSPPAKGLRVGVPRQYFPEVLSEAVSTTVRAAIDRLAELGVSITSIDLPLTDLALAAYYLIVPAEISTNLSRYDGIRYGMVKPAATLDEQYRQTRSAGFGDEVKRRIMIGTFSLSAGYSDKYYLQAAKVRRLVADEFSQAFKQVDIIATPTSPTPAFKLGEKFADPLTMYLADIFTVPASLAGLPALSVPAGTVDKLPIGLQLIGPRYGEPRLLSVAHAFEKNSKHQAPNSN